LTVPEACLRAIEAGSDMVLICEREENILASRDELARAVREKHLSARALAAAERRMSWALKLTGEPESFDADEFDAVSRQFAQLKRELKSAEETGEYAPLFGTADGSTRRSSNF
jgi:beta-glucosidase-like glycosyl hydrolase